MVRALLVALMLLLTACTTEVGGRPAPAETQQESPPVESGLLRFRDVLQMMPAEPGQPLADLVALRALRQPADPTDAAVQAALGVLDCTTPDPLAGQDDQHLPLVACDSASEAAFVLGPSFLTGADISAARAEDTEFGYVVSIEFTSSGARVWSDFTEAHVGQQVAMLLDTDVITAPAIQEPITDGRTQIAGGGVDGFTQDEAEELAARIAASS